jgi:hypothetical protein
LSLKWGHLLPKGGEVKLNRNVSILIIILVILLLAGYLLVLRSRMQTNEASQTAPVVEETITETPVPTTGVVAASPSATATPSGKLSPTAKPTKTSTGSGSSVK